MNCFKVDPRDTKVITEEQTVELVEIIELANEYIESNKGVETEDEFSELR